MRHLTDVEIEARIATRMAALNTRVRRLELTVQVLLTATEALVQDAPRPFIAHLVTQALETLGAKGDR